MVELAYDMSQDLRTATGTEKVTFRPDERICEVIFRAWPNKPATAAKGNSLTVSSVSSGGTALEVTTEQAGAPEGSPGTLVRATLPQCVPAGEAVSVDVAFTVTVAPGTDERMGVDTESRIAWLGSSFPMLAWVNGHGWQDNPAVDVVGEMAGSDVFRLADLAVTVPAQYSVGAVGTIGKVDENASAGTATHHFSAEAVRDVPFTAGDLSVTEVTSEGRPVHVVMPSGGHRVRGSDADWAAEVSRLIGKLESHFGDFPYSQVWVHVLPGVNDGVEFGEAFQITGRQEPAEQSWLIAHELAHAWFYGLVGNNQGVNPWLDESAATYAQELVAPLGSTNRREQPGLEGELGQPMTWWASGPQKGAYEDTVYTGGAYALMRAREEVGEERFDSLLRSYLNAKAYGFAVPGDLEKVLESDPAALRILREAGAWSGGK